MFGRQQIVINIFKRILTDALFFGRAIGGWSNALKADESIGPYQFQLP